MKQWLIGSDLDGTLLYASTDVRVHESIEIFNQTLSERKRKQILVYVTGRHFEYALRGVREAGLIEPDFYICDVGTFVYERVDGDFVCDEMYRSNLSASWDEYKKDELCALLENIHGLTLQGRENQGEFKLSYYISLEKGFVNIQRAIHERVADSFSFNITYSIDPSNDVGYLDILPKSASKEYALNYLAQKIGIGNKWIVYAGDSGNDLSVCRAGIRFIAPQKVGRDVEEFLASEEGKQYTTFRATKPYAYGVLEGLEYFKML